MSRLAENLKRRLFWVIARVCFTVYRWFPLFGTLRASIAIVHHDGKFLVIQRNDGRGVSLPGGIAGRNEPEEETLRREVFEETGMTVISAHLGMRYYSNADVPCDISVYRVEATGDLRESWEGMPRWLTLSDVEAHMLESQRPVLKLLREIADPTGK